MEIFKISVLFYLIILIDMYLDIVCVFELYCLNIVYNYINLYLILLL